MKTSTTLRIALGAASLCITFALFSAVMSLTQPQPADGLQLLLAQGTSMR